MHLYTLVNQDKNNTNNVIHRHKTLHYNILHHNKCRKSIYNVNHDLPV